MLLLVLSGVPLSIIMLLCGCCCVGIFCFDGVTAAAALWVACGFCVTGGAPNLSSSVSGMSSLVSCCSGLCDLIFISGELRSMSATAFAMIVGSK